MGIFGKKKTDNIISQIYRKGRLKRAVYFILGIFIAAISFNIFMLPNDIVYGISGLAVITKKVLGWDIPTTILVGDLILIVLSFVLMGTEKTSKTILGSLLYPLFVKVTEYVIPYITLGNTEPILLMVFGAIVHGFGLGLILKSGYTTGGTDILNQVVAKFGKMSIGNAMYLTDGVIVVAALFVFGLQKFLYALITIAIISYITDKVILGISQSKTFFIITEHETAVKKFIRDELSHGITVIDSRGGFSGDVHKMIMCTIPTRDYFVLKEGLLSIDPEVFFIATDAYEVSGGSTVQ